MPKSQTPLKKDPEPAKVFGEEELIKLIEVSESSNRDISKCIKWFRKHLGRKHFAPHLRDLLKKHLEKLEEHHEVLVKTFKDIQGKEIYSTLAKIKDLECFIK